MTAKELRTEIFKLHTGTRPKAKDVMEAVDKLLDKALEEQREICFIEARKHGLASAVKNAPKPDINV